MWFSYLQDGLVQRHGALQLLRGQVGATHAPHTRSHVGHGADGDQMVLAEHFIGYVVECVRGCVEGREVSHIVY